MWEQSVFFDFHNKLVDICWFPFATYLQQSVTISTSGQFIIVAITKWRHTKGYKETCSGTQQKQSTVCAPPRNTTSLPSLRAVVYYFFCYTRTMKAKEVNRSGRRLISPPALATERISNLYGNSYLHCLTSCHFPWLLSYSHVLRLAVGTFKYCLPPSNLNNPSSRIISSLLRKHYQNG